MECVIREKNAPQVYRQTKIKNSKHLKPNRALGLRNIAGAAPISNIIGQEIYSSRYVDINIAEMRHTGQKFCSI